MRRPFSTWLPGAAMAALAGVTYVHGSGDGSQGSRAPAGRSTAAAAQPSGFDSSKARDHLREMVSIGPRPSGSAAIRRTRAYITRQRHRYGLVVSEPPVTATTPLSKVDMNNLSVAGAGRRAERILLPRHYDAKLYRD